MAIDVSIRRLRYYWSVYLLIALPLLGVLVFSYYPIFNGLVHIFYRWDGDTIEEFVGLKNIRDMFGDSDIGWSFVVVAIFIVANVIKMIPSILTAVIIHRLVSDRWQYAYRVLFVIPMIVPMIVWILIWKYYYEPTSGFFNQILRAIHVLGPTDNILWLSDKWLVIPSLIFMGFPWVGAFGVLIYLAGLQNIPQSTYEAANLDGAGPLQTLWYIELPLIMTQIRITLVLMIIQTVQNWQFVYLFLGEQAGPDHIADVPGLVLFRESFSQGRMGYGCAIGFLLFIVTLVLTWINNKVARVER
ncbi:MAG: sugar ABC transporter permease [Verrucomicrobia bacterium]|jgi:raffinose/stachyose/melibiose transport system permease protein|nr:sugar ABC transporter permease [Verrucomicrobiota bacterium]